MSFLKYLFILFFFHIASASAYVVKCDPSTSSTNNYNQWSTMHQPFNLTSPRATITLGANIPDWHTIYSVNAIIGIDTGNCNSVVSTYYAFLNNAQPVGSINGYDIYSTNISGIGISVSAPDVVGKNAVNAYPKALFYTRDILGLQFEADIKYWKIPGTIPAYNGPVTITGPDTAVLYMSSGSTFTSSNPDRIVSDDKAYISGSRILTITMTFQSGTCNIQGDNVKVDMGDSTAPFPWKDASFNLICPNAMGYDGMTNSKSTYTYPYNIDPKSELSPNSPNGKVQISIAPYTQVVDANRGIIALDGTGAQGYGIQLAWGDYTTQNSQEPLNPVVLNSYVAANTLNPNFSADDTPVGGNGFHGSDNTIKMAARYIRTAGNSAPGPANAVVQVIANYQ
ncbi:TPA: hypothetical protein N2O00_001249 [Citrobacter amalonaticus]|nr:hypothetical protein [Citrobacter amalonaticus]